VVIGEDNQVVVTVTSNNDEDELADVENDVVQRNDVEKNDDGDDHEDNEQTDISS
jgi:hypothetical protein